VSATVGALLVERAATHAEGTFLRFAGAELTFAEVEAKSNAVARGLRDLGVDAGDTVAMLLPNCADMVLTWFAANRLGAVAAPVNTAFRGAALAHVLNLSGAGLLVLDAGLVESVAAVAGDLRSIRTAVVRGDPGAAALQFPQWTVLPWEGMETHESGALPTRGAPADPALVLFTSGTTGRSKGCVLSHRIAVRQAELMVEHFGLRSDDVLYCPYPLFHLDASVLTVMPALVLGATAAIGARFSASGFWPEVRAFGATVFDFMGATLTILHKQPERDDDRDNPVRLGWGVPLPDFAPQFERRFGLRLVEAYGSTDVGVPIYSRPGEPRRPGACGRPIDAYDVRLFDGDDLEVPVGAVGEIVVRPNEPSLISDGYLGMPDETVKATRNLWFHTGDLARRDVEGFIYFVGRGTDTIRRRGENISAFEVEEVIEQHPDVVEVAAFGVPSELTEEDVMVTVVPRPGRTVDPVDLVSFCAERMARFMVPRYVDVVSALPKTPTEKVEKYLLRERGVTATTWDAAAAGSP
jgi:crotonobetaine/carnitine-CoA ligase